MYFSQRRNGEEGSRREPIGCRRGLGHPHRHFQRRASGVFHCIGAIGMARRGNDWQSLAGMRMKGIINRHGGRHGVVERFPNLHFHASSLKASISIARPRASSRVCQGRAAHRCRHCGGGPEDQPACHPHTASARVPGAGRDAAVATGYDPLATTPRARPHHGGLGAAAHRLWRAGGQQVRRIGSGFGHEGEVPTLIGPRCASVQGFSLHANTQVPAHRRTSWSA